MKTARTLRLALLGTAVALSLSACNRDAKPAEAEKPAAKAAVEGPLTYESTTPYAKVKLVLPEAVKAFPALYQKLYADEVGALKDYSEGAQSDRSEFGSADLPPYEKQILYGTPVETDRLFSMIRTDFDYSGGAHPNTTAKGVLWDKTGNKFLSAADLFASDADKAAMSRTLCDAVNQAKKSRPGSIALGGPGTTWSCPELSKVAVALAAGDQPGKASGITFLLDAYAVGPYVEGPYYLTVPFAALGKGLNPVYAADFAGTGKQGDVTNDLRPA